MYEDCPRSCLILSCLLAISALLCPIPFLDLYAWFGACACVGKAVTGRACRKHAKANPTGGAA